MIIVFGSSGTLGTSIINELSLRGIEFGVTTNTRHEEVKNYINKKNLKPKFITKCDVCKFKEVKKVIKKAYKISGKISGIINNFAFTYQKNPDKFVTKKDILNRKKIFNVNYFGIVNVFESLLSFEKLNKKNNISVVNVTSNAIKTLNASNEHYISSKAAVEQLSKYYAHHYGSQMNINCVAPGLMLSNLTNKRYELSKKKVLKKIPLKRLIAPDEVAELIVGILIDYKGLNGQTIYIDGGRVIKLND